MNQKRELTLDNFRQTYLEKTTTLDRAEAHFESLYMAKHKVKTSVKMRVTTQPNVMNKDDVEFQRKWRETTQECERKLLDLLLQHLQNIMS